MFGPMVGITLDNRSNTAASGHYESPIRYSRVIIEAGGLPVLLPHDAALAGRYVGQMDGLLLTGGADPRTEAFGAATHTAASRLDQRRQAFELALLAACDRDRQKAVLGVCLGMQLLTLHHGGRLQQHLPDVLPQADRHQADRCHPVRVLVGDSVLGQPDRSAGRVTVVSRHHQAVDDPGTLRVVAQAPDGVIEAVDDPARRFYLGVQWHPERGGPGCLNRGLIQRFVAACRR